MAPFTLSSNLQLLTDPDADRRFMALSDIAAQYKLKTTFDNATQLKIIHAVMQTMKGAGEVGGEAVKCLGTIVQTASAEHVNQILYNMEEEFVNNADEHVQDLATLAIKTVIQEVPPSKTVLAAEVFPALILNLIRYTEKVPSAELELIDLMVLVLEKHGMAMSGSNSLIKLKDLFLQYIQHPRSLMRKKAISGLSLLTKLVNSETLISIYSEVMSKLQSTIQSNDLRSYITLLENLCACTENLGRIPLRDISTILVSQLEIDEDEHRESVLTAISTFISKAPQCIGENKDKVISKAEELSSYDPNYAEDDEGDDEEGEDYDMEKDEFEYSDDEDMTWKVRKASIAVLKAEVLAHPESDRVRSSIMPKLISRINEREENVRLSVMSALDQIIACHKEGMGEIPAAINSEAGALMKRLARGLKVYEQIPKTVTATLTTLFGLVSLHQEAISNNISDVQPALRSLSAKAESSSSEVTIGNTILVYRIWAELSADLPFSDVCEIISLMLKPPFERKAILMIQRLSSLLPMISNMGRKELDVATPQHVNTLHSVHSYCLDLFQDSNNELEVRSRALSVFGAVLSVPNFVQSQGVSILEKGVRGMMTCLSHPSLNEIAINELGLAFRQGASGSDLSKGTINDCATQIIPAIFKANKNAKLSALEFICIVAEKYPSALEQKTAKECASQLLKMLEESDYQVLDHSLKALTSLASISNIIQSADISAVMQLMSRLGSVSEAAKTVNIFLAEVTSKGIVNASQLIDNIEDIMEKQVKAKMAAQRFSAVREHVTVLASAKSAIISAQGTSESTVEQCLQSIQNAKDDEIRAFFSLCLLANLSYKQSSRSAITNKLIESLESLPSDELKHAASSALGCVVSQDIANLLPTLLKALRTNTVITPFLSESIHPILSSNTFLNAASILELWVALKSMAGTMQENSRFALAESMARLAAKSPETGMAQLTELIAQVSPSARYIAVTSYSRIIRHSQIHPVFLGILPSLPKCLEDSDVDVRRMAIKTVETALQFHLAAIRPELVAIQNGVLSNTPVRQELVKTVSMGPFKHHVDEGMETRKHAFLTLGLLLDIAADVVVPSQYISAIIPTLEDNQMDLQIVAQSLLGQLSKSFSKEVALILDTIATRLCAILEQKFGNNANKQDADKHNTLKNSTVLCITTLQANCDTRGKENFIKCYNTARKQGLVP